MGSAPRARAAARARSIGAQHRVPRPGTAPCRCAVAIDCGRGFCPCTRGALPREKKSSVSQPLDREDAAEAVHDRGAPSPTEQSASSVAPKRSTPPPNVGGQRRASRGRGRLVPPPLPSRFSHVCRSKRRRSEGNHEEESSTKTRSRRRRDARASAGDATLDSRLSRQPLSAHTHRPSMRATKVAESSGSPTTTTAFAAA